MDTNYRSQVVGSPYVDEGFTDRLMARTAQLKQAYNAIRGDSIHPHEITQIQQLLNPFMKRVVDLLKEWEKTSRMLKNYSATKLTSSQKRAISNWNTLYQELIVAPTARANTLNAPKRPDSGYVQPTPKASAEIEPANFNSMVAEGIYPQIMMALASNDINKILNAFQTELKKVYTNFINDASSLTGKTEDQVVKTAIKIGGALAKNLALIRGKILGIKSAPKPATSTATPSPAAPTPPPLPVSDPVAPTPPPAVPAAAATPAPSPTPAPTAPSTPTPTATAPSAPTPPSAAPTAAPSTPAPTTSDAMDATTANFVVGVVDHVVNVIIDTIESDKEHSAPFVSKDD
jgi:hypothetical protein